MQLWPILVMILAAQVDKGNTEPASVAVLLAAKKLIFNIFAAIGAIQTVQDWINPDNTGKQLLNQFSDISSKLDGLERDTLWNLDMKIANQVKWGNTLQTLEELLRNVNIPYSRFLRYQRNNGSFQDHTLENFANEIVSHSPDSVMSTMYSLQYLVLGQDHSSSIRSFSLRSRPEVNEREATSQREKRSVLTDDLFGQLHRHFRESTNLVCGMNQSPRKLAYDIVIVILVTLGKISAMVRFSHALLEMMGKGVFTAEDELFSEHSRIIVNGITLNATVLMENLPNGFWRCEPKAHERGRTFEEVAKLLQGYIVNEENINSHGSCRGSCSDYQRDPVSECYWMGDTWYRGRRQITSTGHGFCLKNGPPCFLDPPRGKFCIGEKTCKGTVRKCRSFASSAKICLSEDQHRRYDWIEYNSGQKLGSNVDASSCPIMLMKSDWTRWFVRCSYCFCLCDDERYSDRFFSLLPAVSDIADNKIVIGVRLVKKKRIFYIQVEQGVVGAVGYVERSTIQWKPVRISEAERGGDIFQLSYNQRSVLLLDLRASSDEAVTGVAFHVVRGMLSLRIQLTRITENGVLVDDSSRWITSSGRYRRRLRLGDDLKLLQRFRSPSLPDSRSGHFLSFEASSVTDDAAQTTLPLLDVQEVAPRPAFRLSGVGLYHKGRRGSGGFIGLRVFQG